jgi:hypothetical protein
VEASPTSKSAESAKLLRTAPKTLSWIHTIEPHIVWTPDNKAGLPPAIEVIQRSYLELATTSIDVFNGLSDEQRMTRKSGSIEAVYADTAPLTTTGCLPHAHQVFFWWGYRTHYDHCACQEVAVATTAEAGGVGAIAALVSGFNIVVGVAIGLLAAYLAVQAQQLTAYDTECAGAHVDGLDAGAFQCMSWAAPGVFWIAKVC